jgi:hypothetical protein
MEKVRFENSARKTVTIKISQHGSTAMALVYPSVEYTAPRKNHATVNNDIPLILGKY